MLLPSTNYKYHIYFYLFNIFLLLLVLIISNPINGSKCWLILPKIGSIQPSEFMKISLIITLSKITGNWTLNNKKLNIKRELNLFFKIFLVIFLPISLTFLEPDTGAVFIYLIITISILFVSPLRKRWFIILSIIIVLLLSSFLYLYFFKQDLFINIFGTNLFYRIDRLLDWKNGTGMQLENSLSAIGSANLFGHGYMNTPIYFPESGTDFIFAVLASNFGLIGSILFLILLVFFDKSIINISKKTNNLTNKYIIIGTGGMIIYQQIQNIGMTLGILPITGITLPFISYGGSSLLSYFLIIGIIFKISSDNNKTIN
jgi:rod shape determining protein RodA